MDSSQQERGTATGATERMGEKLVCGINVTGLVPFALSCCGICLNSPRRRLYVSAFLESLASPRNFPALDVTKKLTQISRKATVSDAKDGIRDVFR